MKSGTVYIPSTFLYLQVDFRGQEYVEFPLHGVMIDCGVCYGPISPPLLTDLRMADRFPPCFSFWRF